MSNEHNIFKKVFINETNKTLGNMFAKIKSQGYFLFIMKCNYMYLDTKTIHADCKQANRKIFINAPPFTIQPLNNRKRRYFC